MSLLSLTMRLIIPVAVVMLVVMLLRRRGLALGTVSIICPVCAATEVLPRTHTLGGKARVLCRQCGADITPRYLRATGRLGISEELVSRADEYNEALRRARRH